MITIIEYDKMLGTTRLESRELLFAKLGFEPPYPLISLYQPINDDTYCLLTPCHFTASHNAVVLSQYHYQLAINQEEYIAIDKALTEFFAHYDFAIKKTTDDDWLLSHNKPFTKENKSLELMMPIQELLPDGEHNAFWHKVFIELQMFLQTLPLNQDRERQGCPTINGFIFHGAGITNNQPLKCTLISDKKDYVAHLSQYKEISCLDYGDDVGCQFTSGENAIFFVRKLAPKHRKKLKRQRYKHAIHWINKDGELQQKKRWPF